MERQLTLVDRLALSALLAALGVGIGARSRTPAALEGLAYPREALARPPAEDRRLREALLETTWEVVAIERSAGGVRALPHQADGRGSRVAAATLAVDLEHPLHVSHWIRLDPCPEEFGLAVRDDAAAPWRVFWVDGARRERWLREGRLGVPAYESLELLGE